MLFLCDSNFFNGNPNLYFFEHNYVYPLILTTRAKLLNRNYYINNTLITKNKNYAHK